MSLAVTRQGWKEVLSGLEGDLKEIISVEETIPDEEAFREKFQDLPEEGHAGDPDNNYGIFTRFHEPMLIFIRGIDDTLGLSSPESLSTLFWTVAYIALEELFEEEFKYSTIERSVYRSDLNKKIPFQPEDLTKFPRSTRVQRCLQEIFVRYIKCYMQLIKKAEEFGEEEQIDMQNDCASAGTYFETKYNEWKEQCQDAQQEVASPDDDARWEMHKELGKGTYGTVTAVYEVGTGSLYARKSIRRKIPPLSEAKIEERIRNEVEIMQKLGHKHIARVTLLLRSEQFWSIFMLPVAECDLGTFLQNRCIDRGYPHEELRLIDPWFGCLVSALAYAHSESIKHEDIKPSNVLVKGPVILLTDFGTAIDFSETGLSTADVQSEQGTPVYWPPEDRPYGRAADVFALGCLFAEMITVRQKHSLEEFRQSRYNPKESFGYAFKSNLPKVKRYLREKIDIRKQDHAILSLLEQIFNMLTEDPDQRSPARRVKGKLREWEDKFFCNSCA